MSAVTPPRELDSSVCSIARTMELIGHPWTLLVLRDLFNGVRRFDDLTNHLGIARNVLARRLGGLVDGAEKVGPEEREVRSVVGCVGVAEVTPGDLADRCEEVKPRGSVPAQGCPEGVVLFQHGPRIIRVAWHAHPQTDGSAPSGRCCSWQVPSTTRTPGPSVRRGQRITFTGKPWWR